MFAALFLICALYGDQPQDTEEDQFYQFQEWKSRMNKHFASQDEEDYRFRVFEANNKKIKFHNAQKDISYRMGLNKFSDITQEEFRSIYLVNLSQYVLEEKAKNKEPKRDFILQKHHKHNNELKQNQLEGSEFLDLEFSLPDNYDSRDKGWIGAPRNQGSCGSCWTFSTMSTIEAAYAIRYGTPIDLAEQQLVDCGKRYNGRIEDGCYGGWMPSAFDYLSVAGGATEEYLYPYTGVFGTCQNRQKKVKVSGYVQIGSNEQSIKNAIVKYGSLAIAVDADEWYLYESGIFKASSLYSIDHAVNAIGWGIQNGRKYFTVRNSWGGDWGERGTIRLDTSDMFYDFVFAVKLA